MAKSIEEDLAEYLVRCQRGPWTSQYNRECVALWRKIYGDQVAEKAEALARERWDK